MERLIQQLIISGVLKSREIISAFKKIDRKNFVLPEYKDEAYADIALPIGYGQTISQPTVVAFMLELLKPKKGDRILDVGSGSGWTTALLAELVGSKGKVYGLELLPELAAMGKKNLNRYKFSQAEIRQAESSRLGLPHKAPFDKILVSATSDEIPHELISQMKTGGIMVIPVGNAVLKVVKKGEDDIETEKYEGFSFVPLIKN